MGKLLKKSNLVKGIIIFVLVSVCIQVGQLIFTADKETWRQLVNFRWYFILLLIVLGVLRWLLDGMLFVTAARRGHSSPLGLWKATLIRLESTVVATAVPILVGTLSTHAYLLHKQKMSVSEAMAITMLRVILPIFIFLFNIPILIFMQNDPESGKFFGQFIKVISPPLVGIVFFVVITLFYPHAIKNGASAFVRWWGRIKFVHTDRILQIEDRLFHEIDQFSEILWTYLSKKKGMLLLALWWIFLAFLVDYFIAITIILGFGYHPPMLRAVLLQFLMRPILFLAPTPGGAGIWDFTYLGFFSLFMDKHLIGISVLLWRIVLTWIPTIIGSIFFTKDMHRDEHLREIVEEKGPLSKNKMEV